MAIKKDKPKTKSTAVTDSKVKATIAAKSLGLNSRAQFAVKKIFAVGKLETLNDWKKIFKEKEVV